MYTAIIIEPRQHEALCYVLTNFLTNLSNDWNIILFHGTQNKHFVNTILNNELKSFKKRITLINLNIDNLSKKNYNNIFYNKLLINNKNIYEYIPTETFLIFQTDSLILTKNKHNINSFLKYDYVGAPWKTPSVKNELVGNGGLSLRKKSKMLIMLKKNNNLKIDLPEDVFFSSTNLISLYKPSALKATFFSIEEIFNEDSFGCHLPWWGRDYTSKLFDLYPEVKILYELNKKYIK